MAQKLLLEQLCRGTLFTSPARCSPDGGGEDVQEGGRTQGWQVEEDTKAQLNVIAEEMGVSET